MSKVYFISGLGADWRMFQFLNLPEHIPQQHIDWIKPLHQHESLPAYAQRLKEQVTEPNPILIGLSFGGLAAIELAKILNPLKVIIISSLATCHALPWHYRLLGKTQIHRWLPYSLMQQTRPLAPWFFGAKTKAERQLLKQVITEIDEAFLRWAMARLLDWKQSDLLPGLIQMHGTDDLVLPLADRHDIIKIKDGEHLMVMHQAEQISQILSQILLDCTYDK